MRETEVTTTDACLAQASRCSRALQNSVSSTVLSPDNYSRAPDKRPSRASPCSSAAPRGCRGPARSRGGGAPPSRERNRPAPGDAAQHPRAHAGGGPARLLPYMHERVVNHARCNGVACHSVMNSSPEPSSSACPLASFSLSFFCSSSSSTFGKMYMAHAGNTTAHKENVMPKSKTVL